jgi:hypothetical protein
MARKIALGAGLTEDQFQQARKNAEELVEKVSGSKLKVKVENK